MPEKTGLHVLISPDAYYAAAPVLNKVNVVPDAVLGERRDEVKVVRALVKASRDFARRPEDGSTRAMAAARPDVDRATLEELGRQFAGTWSVNGGLNRDDAETVDWQYATPDFAGLRRVGLDEWVDLSILGDVLDSEGVAGEYDQPGL